MLSLAFHLKSRKTVKNRQFTNSNLLLHKTPLQQITFNVNSLLRQFCRGVDQTFLLILKTVVCVGGKLNYTLPRVVL